MRSNPIGLAAVLAVMAVVWSAAQDAREASVRLAVAGHANATASLAADGSFVTAVWGATKPGGTQDVYLAISRNGGRAFDAPVRVSDGAGAARLSGEQPPRVSLVRRATRDPAIVVVWTAKSAAGTQLLTSRSGDGGKSFGHATVVPGGDSAGNRGWEATAIDRNGHVVAVWLDHRELAAAPGAAAAPMSHAHDGQAHTGHATPVDGAARAQLSKLYFGRVDGSEAARAVTGGVCYCCRTSIAADTDGSIYAAWRHVYPGNIRDIAFAMSRDGGRGFGAPIRVSDDRWVLDGCPENGPAMAVDRSHAVHLVWPTLVSGSARGSEPTLALFHAASGDGRAFSARSRIPTEGVPRHPQLTVDSSGSLVAAWDEQESGTRRIVIARAPVRPGQPVRFVRTVLGDRARAAVYPALAVASDGVVAAWTEGPADSSLIHVERPR